MTPLARYLNALVEQDLRAEREGLKHNVMLVGEYSMRHREWGKEARWDLEAKKARRRVKQGRDAIAFLVSVQAELEAWS